MLPLALRGPPPREFGLGLSVSFSASSPAAPPEKGSRSRRGVPSSLARGGGSSRIRAHPAGLASPLGGVGSVAVPASKAARRAPDTAPRGGAAKLQPPPTGAVARRNRDRRARQHCKSAISVAERRRSASLIGADQRR